MAEGVKKGEKAVLLVRKTGRARPEKLKFLIIQALLYQQINSDLFMSKC